MKMKPPAAAAPVLGAFAVMATALAGAVGANSASDPLQPLAFLAGHCFKGEVAAGKDTDEHCFSWLYGGKALRDVHTVRGLGHPDYVGESTYYYDSGAKRIEYLYIENAGGVMRGTVEPGDGALVFPPTTYVANGQAMTLRVRWTLQGNGYEAWSEAQDNGGWATMFKVRMSRSS
jgi:hypothetical protein